MKGLIALAALAALFPLAEGEESTELSVPSEEPISATSEESSEEISSEPETSSSEAVPSSEEPVSSSKEEPSSKEPISSSEEASDSSSEEEPAKEQAKVRYSVFYVNANNEEVADKKDTILGEETYKHGDVLFYADEWNVGDEVRFAVKRNASYKAKSTKLYIGSYDISSVTVNFADLTSQTLLPTDGVYSFVARDEQELRVVFSDEIESFTSMDLTETNWRSFFSTQNLVTIVMFLLTIFVAGGASVVITKLTKRLTKKESDDLSEVISKVTEALNPVITDSFSKYVAPSIEKMGIQTDKSTAMTKGLAKCIILMQSSDPKDKIALAEELENLDKDNSDVAEQVKKAMQEVIDNNRLKKEEQDAAIKKVEETTASLTEVEDSTGNYGQI